MKRSFIIILTAYITFLSACYKDKGNYDYNEINDVQIGGMAASYTYVLGTDLHIEPKIQNKTNDTSANNYYWILTRGETTILDTIGRSAVLDTRINVTAADDYMLWLRVIDKASGVAFKASAKLTVSTLLSAGMLLMGTDDNGNAEAEFITMVKDTFVYHNMLSKSGLPTLRDPVSFAMVGGKGDTSANMIRLWVMTKSGSYFLDRNSMGGSTSRKFANICITNEINRDAITPVVVMPQVKDRTGNAGSTSAVAWCRAAITTDGDIFATHSVLNKGDYYGNPVNRLATNYSKRLKAAPYFWYPIIDYGLSASFLWFDTENQRFLSYSSFANDYSTIMTDGATDMFSWNLASQGRTLIYGENSRNTEGGLKNNGNSYAIVKGNAGQHYIYKFYSSGTSSVKRDMFTISPIATDFDKANFYAFSSKRPLIFYSVGNKLYAYDYNKGLEKFYQFPELSTDEITMLKFDTQIDGGTNALYVATYNAATKGRLRRYIVGTNPNFVDITPVDRSDWDGLIKIKDMNWRGAN